MWRIGDRLMLAGQTIIHPFAPKERTISLGGFGVIVRRGTSDRFVARESLGKNDYHVVPHGVVVDLGANIGAFSLFASRTAANVYAFEPDPSNYRQLVRNLALNDVSNVVPIQAAISGSSGKALLHSAKSNKGSSSLVVDVSDDTVEVEVMTLRQLMDDYELAVIDLLKVDIEGSEYDLFAGLSDDDLAAVGEIVMEVHKMPGRSSRSIVDRLRHAGFEVTRRRTLLSVTGLDYFHAVRSSKDLSRSRAAGGTSVEMPISRDSVAIEEIRPRTSVGQ
jgi:FkbM family methyltransferase